MKTSTAKLRIQIMQTHFPPSRYAVIPWIGCIRWGKPPVALRGASRGVSLELFERWRVFTSDQPRLRVAVVGGGIAGLSSAWLLSSRHDVVLFEADGRLGGHANTTDAPDRTGGTTPVDTGFIVYNEPNYPNFTALLDHL